MSATVEGEPAGRPPGRSALFAWCLYDWANSAFPAVILTFIFAPYFTRAVARTPVEGTAQWGLALTLSAFAIALISPVLGAIADQGGRRKPWLLCFTVLSAFFISMLWYTKPEPADILWALAFLALANLAFEFAIVFYNAMLPGLVSEHRMGRLSGWGWGLGYAGGLACLVIALFGLVDTETPLFGLDTETAEHVRAAAPLAALWYAIFAVPLFLFTPDRSKTGLAGAEAVRSGLKTLGATLRNVRRYKQIVRFLVARMIYIDGLNTLFAFGGIYAAGVYGMDVTEVIRFGIALNISAGVGATLFAWIDDWIGAKRTILIALGAITLLSAAIVLVDDKALFWALGVMLGAFFGPAQAASRSLMARLSPTGMEAEMFGLYALSGKATAFLGPALLAWVATAFDSQRAGMATVLIFLVTGFVLLLPLKEPTRTFGINAGNGACR
jgi:UMF1 family MFS transporter